MWINLNLFKHLLLIDIWIISVWGFTIHKVHMNIFLHVSFFYYIFRYISVEYPVKILLGKIRFFFFFQGLMCNIWKFLDYTTATAMHDLSHICDLHNSSWQGWILKPLSKARDWIYILMDISQVLYHWATMGIPSEHFFKDSILSCPFDLLFITTSPQNLPLLSLKYMSIHNQILPSDEGILPHV